ncbi:MAG: Smr/MutS family protein [Tannerellaceae bacterium]|nr:Smr/MutS family protein [Tannerellaceae bacterium]
MNTEIKVGFEAVRQLLADLALTAQGKEKVCLMAFSHSFEDVSLALHRTAEFLELIRSGNPFPSQGFPDLRPSLQRIRPEGTWLDESDLADLHQFLSCLHQTLRFFQTPSPEHAPCHPLLTLLAANVPHFPQLAQRLDALLDNHGSIRDDASPELARLRKDLASASASISKTLLSILRSAQSQGWVDKDAAPALRDGRLVIPLNPAYKRKIHGIVHDESASGKTVFIEPEQVVDANNRIRELEAEEKREITRILFDFTLLVRPLLHDLAQSLEFLSEIDFIRAKALLANQIDGHLPVLSKDPEIDWYHAVHPLLFLALQRQGRTVVPLDIALHDKQRILLISGPNAGGKSVCLKTVGLLQFMLQCGLLIPVYPNSRAGIFSRILIDIGDSQSIENDLSTYSSHLSQMKRFLQLASPDSLLLIDEFGAGTEPRIGGAIAETLLDRFNRKGAFAVITTHYTNLKHFAQQTEGIANAAMLFDRHRMEPLFRLDTGNPGSSFAIEIARRMGLPEEVIADAARKAGDDLVDIDKYLQDIVRDKRYWESKRQDIRRQEKKLEELTARYESDMQALEKLRNEILHEARDQAAHIIADANARIEYTIREIRETQADKERTKALRKQLTPAPPSPSPAHTHTPPPPPKKQTFTSRDGLEAGHYVKLHGHTVAGKILSIHGKKAFVAFGNIKSFVPLDRLEKARKADAPAIEPPMFATHIPLDAIHQRRLHFRQELDLHGLHAEEAKKVIAKYIDDAILLGVHKVSLIHGTGSGVLRQLVREHLDNHPAVRRYSDGHPDHGGAGITLVEFL